MPDPFPFEAELDDAIAEWHESDPVCLAGRVLFAGVIAAGLALGAGLVLALDYALTRGRRLTSCSDSLGSSPSSSPWGSSS